MCWGGLRGTGPAPRSPQAKVIRSRSTRCLSFPLTVTTFLASSSWTLYGLQLSDLYIMVGWGQREAGSCCGFLTPPPNLQPLSAGCLAPGRTPSGVACVSHSRARD